MSAMQSKRHAKLTRWVPLTLCLLLVPTLACKRDAGPDNQIHYQTKGSRDVAAAPGRTGGSRWPAAPLGKYHGKI